ncbi:response regulator transcription factor [Gracilinema caldarium]|uniref:Two component transcriptional regulator, LuxR family n=1 Tax=Gracilinema caldarium (strain ATCC 51460 / DSM 7334 / H1) TaxID=744872 RepID=F8EWQ5_GRAC1|nr:response regulator transcription factor [Gracilinema caldarium]AEJ18291.1 two component transcriptional regulator, LuxR family [Gracilinema caldarium DSM 7334]
MIKIGIVDDQDLVRDSLKILLSAQDDFEVVGIGKDGYEALKLVENYHPDVLLLDIRMPIMDGVEATAMLKTRSPNTSIIILTTFDDDEYVLNAIRNGASGYLLKSSAMDELAKAIRTVHAGGSLMTPEIATKAFKMFSEIVKDYPKRISSIKEETTLPCNLNKTELEIISHIGNGLANKEIASMLKLSEGTVRNYISSILQKTGLRDRTQIAIFAVRHKMV